MLRLSSPTTKAWAPDVMPHVNMMRAIQTRAPNLLSARLLGTSKTKYPMKKIPAGPPLLQCQGLVAGRNHGKGPAPRVPRPECLSWRALDQAGLIAAALA